MGGCAHWGGGGMSFADDGLDDPEDDELITELRGSSNTGWEGFWSGGRCCCGCCCWGCGG